VARPWAGSRALKSIKVRSRGGTDHGIGYGMSGYLDRRRGRMAAYPAGQISFNYLGQFGGAELPEELKGLGWNRLPTRMT
jgi:non-ribosomal peptide synthase protein (TIGR01720 family)